MNNKRKKFQKRNHLQQIAISNNVALTLFVVCLLASIYNLKVADGQQLLQQAESKTQTSLPTVIVRGFLVSTSNWSANLVYMSPRRYLF